MFSSLSSFDFDERIARRILEVVDADRPDLVLSARAIAARDEFGDEDSVTVLATALKLWEFGLLEIRLQEAKVAPNRDDQYVVTGLTEMGRHQKQALEFA